MLIYVFTYSIYILKYFSVLIYVIKALISSGNIWLVKMLCNCFRQTCNGENEEMSK